MRRPSFPSFALFASGVIAMIPRVVAAQATSRTTAPWTASGTALADFTIVRDTTTSHDGKASVRISAADTPGGFAGILMRIPAASHAGHSIRLSMFLRAEALGGSGGVLWARADDAGRKSVAFINSGTTPLRGTTGWTSADISLQIPASAAQVYVGAFSSGRGSLWIDDIRLESDGGTPPLQFGFENPEEFVAPAPSRLMASPREAPRAISARGLENVSAFARTLGYVRFFHPSSQSVRVNWDELAVRGVRAVEKAPDADSLAATLRAIFAPLAPTVVFSRTGYSVARTISPPAGATHVVYWQHAGIGTPSGGSMSNSRSVYSSERMIVPIAAVGKSVSMAMRLPLMPGTTPPRVPDPTRPLEVALDGGVTISVPIALYTADSVIPDSMRAARSLEATERFAPADRATRLAGVVLAWSLFEHFYPYFDVVRTDWPGALRMALRSASTDRNDDAFQLTLRRLVAALHDGHGNVFIAGQEFAMPDVRLGWAEGQVIVTAPGDSGAARGLKRGDVLVSVDGRPVGDVLADSSAFVSGATPQWVRTRALSSLLLGRAGTMVTVNVRGADGAQREARLTRSVPRQADAPRPDKIAEVAPGVMYVDLDRITDADFTGALPRLQSARGIVFDMRGYPRQVNTPAILAHLTDSAVRSPHFEIPILTMPDRREVGYVDSAWPIAPIAPRLHARVAFLTGGGAISYAESTLGVVEGYRLAAIVGEPSAGTNGNINPFVLPGGYTVNWTGMRVVKRDGSPHHGVGITPTVPVSPTIAGIRAGRDEVLERAVTLVSSPFITP